MTSKNPKALNPNDKPPKLINNRYEVISKLGEGGMGVVYKAFDPQLYQEVSIKLLKNIGDMEESALRFQKEAKAASQLSHPNLAPVLDFGITDEGVLFMVSRFIEGETLTRAIKRDGSLSLEEALSVVNQIADCMAYIHSKGILHRDIKAGNIIISREEDKIEAFVLDFGIAKLIDQHVLADGVTSAGTILGSPSYMSPEQGQGGDLDFRSDIYSLGCLAFQLFTAKLPFHSDTVFDVIKLHIEAPIPEFNTKSDREDIPEEVESAVLKMLEKEPGDRIQTMKEVAEIFASFIETYAPKHSWVVKQDDNEKSLLSNFSNFSSSTSKQAKISIGLALLFISGTGIVQLINALPRWLEKKEATETSSKHVIKNTSPLESLTDTADEFIKLDAKIGKSHYPMYGKRDTYFVVASNAEKMPDWSQLKAVKKEFVLDLRAPALREIDLAQILMLKKLVGLCLSLPEGVPKAYINKISNKESLKVLKIVVSPKIDVEDLKRIRRLPKLNYLIFDDCNITDEKADEIAKIKNLEVLYIKNDKVLTSSSIKHLLKNLTKLNQVSLAGCKLNKQSLNSIAKAKNIETLLLTSTDITDEGIAQLVKSNLQASYLDLGKTKITRKGFLQLNKLKKLKEVALGSNPNLERIEVQFLSKTATFKVNFLHRSMKEVDNFWDL